jgi:hypothetical protein
MPGASCRESITLIDAVENAVELAGGVGVEHGAARSEGGVRDGRDASANGGLFYRGLDFSGWAAEHAAPVCR